MDLLDLVDLRETEERLCWLTEAPMMEHTQTRSEPSNSQQTKPMLQTALRTLATVLTAYSNPERRADPKLEGKLLKILEELSMLFLEIE